MSTMPLWQVGSEQSTLHPSVLSRLPSSQGSVFGPCMSRLPSPQTLTLQLSRQSPVSLLPAPASHSSPAAALTLPSPHERVVQSRLQVAVSPAAPGSHCSPGSRMLLPHFSSLQVL